MAQIGFLVITFDSEVQMTSGFHWCASFDEVFHMTPIMTMILHLCGGAKGPKMAILGHFRPFDLTKNLYHHVQDGCLMKDLIKTSTAVKTRGHLDF